MIKMIKNLNQLLGKQIKKLIPPIVYSILDAMLNGTMFGMMILVLIDLVNGSYSLEKLNIYSINLVVIFLPMAIFKSIAFTQTFCRTSDLAVTLRLKIGNHIRNLNLGYFNKNSIGTLSGSLTTDINDFETTLGHSLSDFIKTVGFLFFSLVIALFLDWRYALAIIGVVIIALPFLTISGKVYSSETTSLRIAKQNVVTRIIEYITGIKTFRLYKLTGVKFNHLDEALTDLKNKSIKSEIKMLPYSISFTTVASFVVPTALLMGTYFLFEEKIGVVSFLGIVLLSTSVSSMLSTLASLYPQMRFLTNSTKNLLKVLDEKPFSYDRENAIFSDYSVNFDNVRFSYTDDVEVLKGISFYAKAGTTTALVGPSGSGKTTVISLISRFWDINSGKIEIGGQDIRHYKPDELTTNMAVVFQDVYLLNDTIKNNIRVGKQDATDEEIIKVAKLANCHNFIMEKENGYDTLVGEGGATLSGGEKQRISIARALLKDAPIILLDETTSNLDADNEKEIQYAFDRLMKNKTVFVIAHRLNTIVNADNILVLDDGQIIESGNHEKLLNLHGWYAEMYEEQRKAKEWKVKGEENE